MKILSNITIEKTILVVVVVLMVAGAPIAVLANRADAEVGRHCTYGPHNDECKYNTEYQLGFRTGVSDAHKTSGPINDDALNHTEAFNVGWAEGYCSVNQSALGIKPLFDCNDDTA